MPDEEQVERDEIEQYRRSRRRMRNALAGIIASAVLIVVFNHPEAWGDGKLAYDVFVAAHVVGFFCLILAFIAQGQVGEARGYYRGKHGKAPPSR